MKLLMTAFLAVFAVGCTAPAQGTGIFHFTGTDFKEGAGSDAASIAIRDGYLPAIRNGVPHAATKAELPAGHGGLALLCYVQTSGGKVGSKAGYLPLVEAPIEITGNGMQISARTNEAGYLFLSLPAGHYEVRFSAFKQNIRIDKGKNTLAALRGGKRMVD